MTQVETQQIWTEASQQAHRNIIARLQEEVCSLPDGCLDPYCKAMVKAITIVSGDDQDD
jgi:hypothetical protein